MKQNQSGRSMIEMLGVLAMIVQGGKHYVYGETVCHGGTDDKDNSRHCLRHLTLPEISDICKTCQSTNCAVYLVF